MPKLGHFWSLFLPQSPHICIIQFPLLSGQMSQKVQLWITSWTSMRVRLLHRTSLFLLLALLLPSQSSMMEPFDKASVGLDVWCLVNQHKGSSFFNFVLQLSQHFWARELLQMLVFSVIAKQQHPPAAIINDIHHLSKLVRAKWSFVPEEKIRSLIGLLRKLTKIHSCILPAQSFPFYVVFSCVFVIVLYVLFCSVLFCSVQKKVTCTVHLSRLFNVFISSSCHAKCLLTTCSLYFRVCCGTQILCVVTVKNSDYRLSHHPLTIIFYKLSRSPKVLPEFFK